jgi:membrane protein implicated in regulation of membrane protease activity
MNDLILFYKELPFMMQIFWGCAIVSSVFMLVQLVLSLIGMGDFEFDADAAAADGLDASGGVDLFTVKNITNFFVGFGWAGISLRDVIETDWILLAVSVGFGILFVVIFILLFRQLMKLENNSAVGVEETVGKNADVYLRIPAGRGGKGKVQLSVKGAVKEYNAVTDDAENIPSGTIVRITEIIGKDCVLVERL